uniref:MFS transporter n=1 Tax=Anaerolinea thermolimosa TaxID=229919 RepID=A0A7C4KGG6_9CHLR
MENRQRNRLLMVLFFGVLMGALDIAIVGPALPAIRSQFQVSERALAWIFSTYVLFQLVSTPLMAKLSDLYGRRWIYILDLALFAAGSMLVAFSGNFFMVVAGRAIQGFGAGGIFPVASAVIGDTFPPEKRGSALGLIGAVFGLAFLIGPILGGVVLSLATWHWLFLINLPVAGVIILFSIRLLPVTRPDRSPRFDWAGMAILSLLLASLAFGINQLDTSRFFPSLFSPTVGPFLALSLGLLGLLSIVERRAENPLLPGRLFNRRQLGLAYFLSAGAGFAEASLVFMPLLAVISLQGAGITPQNASWMLMPVVLAMMVGSPLAGRLLDRVGSKPVIFIGNLIMTLGLVLLSLFSTLLPLFVVSGALVGLGLSALLGAPVRYIMLNEARPQERSVAQGVVTLFSSIGQLVGSALVGAVAASRASQSPLAGYSAAFLTVAAMGALLLMAAWFLKNREAELETIREHSMVREAEQL